MNPCPHIPQPLTSQRPHVSMQVDAIVYLVDAADRSVFPPTAVFSLLHPYALAMPAWFYRLHFPCFLSSLFNCFGFNAVQGPLVDASFSNTFTGTVSQSPSVNWMRCCQMMHSLKCLCLCWATRLISLQLLQRRSSGGLRGSPGGLEDRATISL